MMRRVLVGVLLLGACFTVPDFENGALRCDRGQCPPGFECRADNRCYRPGGATVDAPIDVPFSIDAGPCTDGDHRCVDGNVEVCQSPRWVPASPSCSDLGQQCFDPGVSGGADAYCGTCLKGAARCTAATPAVRQTCPEDTGVWTDAEPCDAAFGCFDSDGPDAPAAYCGVCVSGDKRCTAGLETCTAGQWSAAENCAATPGWSCIDPAPVGGNDAYCGACLKGLVECHGDNRDQCKPDGSAFITLDSCQWGCTVVACCAEPDCGGRVCGTSLPNACGRIQNCGSGCNGSCCDDGFVCCGLSASCCGTGCCGDFDCCENEVCQPGPCP